MWNRTWSLFISTLRFLFPGHQPLTRFSGHCVTTKQLRHSQHQTMNFNRGGGKKKSFFTAVMKEYTRKKKNQKTNSTSIPQMKKIRLQFPIDRHSEENQETSLLSNCWEIIFVINNHQRNPIQTKYGSSARTEVFRQKRLETKRGLLDKLKTKLFTSL